MNITAIAIKSDTAETPQFSVGQRVRILPSKHFPPTKASGGIRYGIVQGVTNKPGMYLVNEDRDNVAGEWAYVVASYKHPHAGALWHSAAGLKPMHKA